MFGKCRSCGVRLVAVAALCIACGAGAASLPADAIAPAHHSIVIAATESGEPDVPHIPEERSTVHISSAAMSAGGGGAVGPLRGSAASVSYASGNLSAGMLTGLSAGSSQAWGSLTAQAA